MKVILRFPDQDKIKDLPMETPHPKIMWQQLEPEMHSLVAQMPKDKQAEAMLKYGEDHIEFILTGEEDGIPLYTPNNPQK